jgi:hypothetical protein
MELSFEFQVLKIKVQVKIYNFIWYEWYDEWPGHCLARSRASGITLLLTVPHTVPHTVLHYLLYLYCTANPKHNHKNETGRTSFLNPKPYIRYAPRKCANNNDKHAYAGRLNILTHLRPLSDTPWYFGPSQLASPISSNAWGPLLFRLVFNL